LDLIAAGVAIFSPHTAFDSARRGINRQLAEGLGLTDVRPLIPTAAGGGTNGGGPGADRAEEAGAGRYGVLPVARTLFELAASVKKFLNIEQLQVVGSGEQSLERVAVACGSAGEFLEPALAAGCQALVTGETRFHTCLAAEAAEVGLVLAGHYASERFAVETLASELEQQFPALHVWASRSETDPLVWL
jgi:putative NIF3 family GTP cyclohydrolase 1 type 2